MRSATSAAVSPCWRRFRPGRQLRRRFGRGRGRDSHERDATLGRGGRALPRRLGIRRRPHRRRHGPSPTDPPDRRRRTARPLPPALERVDLHAVLLAGVGADRAAARTTSPTWTTTTAWRSSRSSGTRSSRSRATTGRPTRRKRRSRSPCRTTSRVAGSPRSCSSTSPRSRARTASARFIAETLPDNRRMLGVFRDAGFQVVREFADGVVHVTFPIDPTEASQAMQDEREQISEARSVRRLLAPRSDRGDRCRASARDHRPRGVPQPARGRVHRDRCTR